MDCSLAETILHVELTEKEQDIRNEELQTQVYRNWITDNRSSVPQMTSKAITTPTLLIIMGRNSMKV